LTPEKQARRDIDAQLAACGWVVQDYKAVDFSAGRGIVLREVPLKTGPCDYLLLVDRTAVGVIEAKKVGAKLSIVAEQSARYATSLPEFLAHGLTGALPFVYESTGVETFFRDARDPDARSRRVFSFHRPETLGEWFSETDTLRARLARMPKAHPLATTGMRECQTEAIAGLEQSRMRRPPRSHRGRNRQDHTSGTAIRIGRRLADPHSERATQELEWPQQIQRTRRSGRWSDAASKSQWLDLGER
jgi:type I restriction enzyme, R subunit